MPGDPLFSIPNSLCAGPGRGPLWIPISKFMAPDFDIKEAEERATDASFKLRAGEYFKLADIYWRRLPEEGGNYGRYVTNNENGRCYFCRVFQNTEHAHMADMIVLTL